MITLSVNLDFSSGNFNEYNNYSTSKISTPQYNNSNPNIIKIINATHLNQDGIIVDNIFSFVNNADNVWSKTINENEVVRVKFKEELTSKNDITFIPKIISGNPIIEVYEKNTNQILMTFKHIKDKKYNKKILINLKNKQDTFDLKIKNGTLQFDLIIDPYTSADYNATITALNPQAWWILGANGNDYSGNAHNSDNTVGTPTFGTSIIKNGPSINSMIINAAEGYNYPDSTEINTYSNPDGDYFATSLWFNASSIPSNNGNIIYEQGGGTNSLAVYTYENAGSYYIYCSAVESSNYDFVSHAINIGQVYHVGCIWNFGGGNITMYVNGVLVSTDSTLAIGTDLSRHTGDTAIAEPDGNPDNHLGSAMTNSFQGQIADIVMWGVNDDGAVSGANFTTIYDIGSYENYAPTHNTPILSSSPSSGYVTDNLTCTPQNTNDANGDNVKNIFNWKVDSNPLAEVNMPFEGGSNSTATKDYSGNGNDATVSGATWNITGGYDGAGAYKFDSDNDVVTIPALNLNTNTVTMTAWVNGHQESDYSGIIFTRGGTTVAGLDSVSNKLRYHWNNDHYSWDSGLTIPTDTWAFIAMVVSPTNVTMYVNSNSATDTWTVPSEAFDTTTSIGLDSGFSTTRQWVGYIDDIMIYNYTLSPEQISAIYNNNNTLFVSQETSDGEDWTCEVTPNDGYVDGVAKTSNTKSIIAAASATVDWNNPTKDLGLQSPTLGNLVGNEAIIATNDNTNVIISCASGDCSTISDNWIDGSSLSASASSSIQFTCQNSSLGEFSAIFNVTSDEDNSPDQINVSCEFSGLVEPTPQLSTEGDTNFYTQNLTCSDTISNTAGTNTNVSIKWYKDGTLFSTTDYNNSYSSNTDFSTDLDSSNTAIGDVWICSMRVTDGYKFSNWVNTTSLTVKSDINSCDNYWSIDCGAWPTESADNTFDSCDGTAGSASDEHVDNVYLNDTSIDYGNNISVTCEFDPYSSSTEEYIYYYNGTGWRQLAAPIPPDGNIYNVTVSFTPDNYGGTHWVRCIADWDGENDECADSGSYYDNDDLNFNVVAQVSNLLDPTPEIKSYDGSDSTDTDLVCYETVTIPASSSANISVKWYKDDVLFLTTNHNNSYSNGDSFSTNLAKTNTNVGDSWKCSMRLYDGTTYTNWVNSSNLIIKTIMRTCSAYWNIDCGAWPTESADNTFDSCDGTAGGASDEHVDEVFLNASSIDYGEMINVTCKFDPYNTATEEYIYYYNGTGWRQLYSGSAPGSAIHDVSVAFTPDDVDGTHWVRCIADYDGENDECANSGSYYDNDDLNFYVVGYVPPLTTPTPEINSSDGTNRSNQNLNCFDTLTDSEEDNLNVTVKWYKNDVTFSTINYNNNYANGTDFNVILDKSSTSSGEKWICGIRTSTRGIYSNWANSSEMTILNTGPTIESTTLDDTDASPPNELDLIPASTLPTTCEAIVYDNDGGGDISSGNAFFYLTSVGDSASDNSLNHYTNSTCDVDSTYGNANQASVTCTFYTLFYANSGEWTCNITAIDSSSEQVNSSDKASVLDLNAISVTLSDLDFGQLAVGENTGSIDQIQVIKNTGNVNISIKLNTWGTSFNDQRSMSCTVGYTAPNNLRVSNLASQSYDSRIKLTSTNDDGIIIGLTIPRQTTGTNPTQANLYFGMGINASESVQGDCSGNLMFTSVQN